MSQAIVTSSYRGDFDRCRLLCDSIDARVSGHTRHIIAVEARDVGLFRQLSGPRREIVDERDLFPWWLRSVPDPSRLGRGRIWLSLRGVPLKGWHAQQLRRMMLGAQLEETAMVTVDSDVVFLKDFDTGSFEDETGRVAFYRRPGSIGEVDPEYRQDHFKWSRKAGALLGIETPSQTDTAYISTLIAWNTASVRAMNAQIEAVAGQSAIAALCGTRALSECTIYGRFVDEVEQRPDRHFETDRQLCRVYWTGKSLDEKTMRAFASTLETYQVAAGIQSFIGTDTGMIRKVAGLV